MPVTTSTRLMGAVLLFCATTISASFSALAGSIEIPSGPTFGDELCLALVAGTSTDETRPDGVVTAEVTRDPFFTDFATTWLTIPSPSAAESQDSATPMQPTISAGDPIHDLACALVGISGQKFSDALSQKVSASSRMPTDSDFGSLVGLVQSREGQRASRLSPWTVEQPSASFSIRQPKPRLN